MSTLASFSLRAFSVPNLFCALCLVLISSCSKKNGEGQQTNIKGELAFNKLSIGSLYEADSSIIIRFHNYVDSLKSMNRDSLNTQGKAILDIYGELEDRNLINKPFIDLKIDSINIYVTYIDTAEYEKIRHFDKESLLRDNKKIIIELTGEILPLGTIKVIDCKRIVSFEEVEGRTYPGK